MQNFKALGKIRDAHGIKGEVFLISFSKQFEWLKDMDVAYLARREQDEEGEWSEKIHSFPIKRKKAHKIGQILKLEGIDTRNAAELFKGATFQVPTEILAKVDEGGDFFLSRLEGFSVEFEGQDSLGQINGFSSNGAQDLLVVSWNQKTVEIPYVPSFVKDVDFTHQKIRLQVPEGLLFLESL